MKLSQEITRRVISGDVRKTTDLVVARPRYFNFSTSVPVGARTLFTRDPSSRAFRLFPGHGPVRKDNVKDAVVYITVADPRRKFQLSLTPDLKCNLSEKSVTGIPFM